MKTKIEGNYTFHLPIEKVYNAFQDKDLIRAALPGRVHFEMPASNEYKLALQLDVPKVGGLYQGSMNITDTRVPSYYELSASGQGPSNNLAATGRIELSPVDASKTDVRYVCQTDAFDKYNRLVRMAAGPVAKRMVTQGMWYLERTIQQSA